MNPLAILGALARVPWWGWAIAALLAWGGWKAWRLQSVSATFTAAKSSAALERAEAVATKQREVNGQLKAIKEASDAAHLQAQRERAAADRLGRTAEQLRDELAAVRAAARPADPEAARQCQAALEALDLHADVQGRIERAARAIAAFADDAHLAGITCERSADALTNPTTTEGGR